jgi:hypothetical protein
VNWPATLARGGRRGRRCGRRAEGLHQRHEVLVHVGLRGLDAAGAGLLDEGGRPEGHRVERGGGGRLLDAAEEHDRQVGVVLAQRCQRGEPVEDRHLEVEHHHVGSARGDLREGELAVGCGVGPRHTGVALQGAREHASHDDRVVDDEDAHGRGRHSDLEAEQVQLLEHGLLLEGLHEVLVGAGAPAPGAPGGSRSRWSP